MFFRGSSRESKGFIRRARVAQGQAGQAVAEYVLMLLLAVSVFLLLKNTLLKGAYEKFQSGLADQLQNVLFPKGEGGMHRLRIGR